MGDRDSSAARAAVRSRRQRFQSRPRPPFSNCSAGTLATRTAVLIWRSDMPPSAPASARESNGRCRPFVLPHSSLAHRTASAVPCIASSFGISSVMWLRHVSKVAATSLLADCFQNRGKISRSLDILRSACRPPYCFNNSPHRDPGALWSGGETVRSNHQTVSRRRCGFAAGRRAAACLPFFAAAWWLGRGAVSACAG
jgi:hypothetical protein